MVNNRRNLHCDFFLRAKLELAPKKTRCASESPKTVVCRWCVGCGRGWRRGPPTRTGGPSHGSRSKESDLRTRSLTSVGGAQNRNMTIFSGQLICGDNTSAAADAHLHTARDFLPTGIFAMPKECHKDHPSSVFYWMPRGFPCLLTTPFFSNPLLGSVLIFLNRRSILSCDFYFYFFFQKSKHG